MKQTNIKAIGVTLLFISEKNKSFTVFLKSYIFEASDWRGLNIQIKKYCKTIKDLCYLGIEDIFYISGLFGEKEILGKSYIDELTSIKSAKSLLLNEEDYTLPPKNLKEEKWYLVSLIYFYFDRKSKDKLTISCFTPVIAKNIKEVKNKIKTMSMSQLFLKKILPYHIDKMNYKNLKYIGIEDISLIKEDVTKGGAFETTFKKTKSIESIKELLPSSKDLKKSFEKTIS